MFSTISSFTKFSVTKMNESFNKPSYGTKYSVTSFIIIIFFSILFICLFFYSYQVKIPLLRSYFMGGLLERTSCKNTLLGSFKELF